LMDRKSFAWWRAHEIVAQFEVPPLHLGKIGSA
jgi:hypothetical protein